MTFSRLDVTRGAVIFRDTFDQYGPLNGYLDALAFLALGQRLLSIKWLICGWYALSAALLYALGGVGVHRSSPPLR